MAEYGREQRNQLSRVIANNETESRQLKGFVDNRSQKISQNLLIEAIRENENNVIQFVPVSDIVKNTRNRYEVQYRGVGSDFSGGQAAGNLGITGVKNYSARASMKLPSGFYESIDSPHINWNDRQYHKGHILASALGGQGNGSNIFRQDGGQNTTGDWPVFEGLVRNACAENPDTEFVFTANLTGSNIEYNQSL